jgi:hypothetical protein
MLEVDMPASHEFNILRCEIRTGVIIFIKRQEAPVAQPDSIPISYVHLARAKPSI